MLLRALVANALVGVVSLAPAATYGLLKKERAAVVSSALALVLFLVDIVCVYLPTTVGLRGMAWAWSGKALECVLFGTIIVMRHRPLLGWPQPARSLVATAATAIAVSIPEMLSAARPRALSAQRLAFQATMPGIAEELFFRGLLLATLDQGLGRPKRAFGVDFGFGVLVTTLLFYGGHAVAFDAQWRLSVDLASAADFALFGVLLCWLRYRTQSLWPCVLTHNLHNCFIVVRQALA